MTSPATSGPGPESPTENALWNAAWPGGPSPSRRTKAHAAVRARKIVAGTAAAATVGLIGGFAVSAPAGPTEVNGTQFDQGAVSGSSGATTPSTTVATTPTTSSKNGSAAGTTRAATPTTRAPAAARPQTRSRAS